MSAQHACERDNSHNMVPNRDRTGFACSHGCGKRIMKRCLECGERLNDVGLCEQCPEHLSRGGEV